MKVFYENDADLELLRDKKVLVLGYGNQGRAHALNLKDSGVNVRVGLRENSPTQREVTVDGLTSMSFEEGAKWANWVMFLIPDQFQRDVYEKYVGPNLKEGDVLSFAHGLNIHYSEIVPPANVDCLLIAPKSPGALVRETFEQGSGVPCLVAVAQDYSKKALDLSLSYAKALGGLKAGVLQTTFKEETETDLFGEQAVLCGGVTELIKKAYETLVEAGYSPELSYFECMHELKLITDLLYKGGTTLMNEKVSETAEFGNYYSGPKVVGDQVKENMKDVLKEIQEGKFASKYLEDARSGGAYLRDKRAKDKDHLIEKVGENLRKNMLFFKAVPHPSQNKSTEQALTH
jgi:ketol-acid reductoisomerase